MKQFLLVMALMLSSLTSMAADSTQQFVPSNFGGWQNLSASVNDLTYYDSNQLPMQAAVSGQTLHVFWTDWNPNAQGEYCVYYRRSADAGKTWEDARAIVKSKTMKMVDINYVGGTFGTNAKWFNVEGQNVQVATIQESEDGKYSELYYTVSTDGGKTFETRKLVKGDENYHFGRPHIVSDGQTVVVAFQMGKYSGTPYHTRVLTSFDGGKTFSDKEIDLSQKLGDVQVSGKRWAVLGEDDDWNNGMLRGYVYLSTSADGGQTVTTQNVAPIVIDREREGWDDRTWGSLEYMKGHNGDAYNYHPLMTLEGDAINVVFRGCAEEVEGKRPTNDRNHTIFRRSTDFGKTWTKSFYLPESNGSDCTIAAKGEHIYVVQAVHGPLMTYSNDGGKTWDIQKRCYWEARDDGYGNFYELYIAPDDASGQHVYMSGVRGMMAESKDGFRTVNRNFSIGTESWFGGRSNNHSLTILLDSEGTEHWLMNYQAPYQPYKDYFWNIVYRRNDPAPATTGKEMALDVSEKENVVDRPMTNVIIPMSPSLMATAEATTVECWVRVDQDTKFQIASLTNDGADHKGSYYSGGWGLEVSSDANNWFSFWGYLSTEQSINGKGVSIWDRWRLQVKEWGMWHHVALTYDSRVEKDNVRLYADGMLMGTATEKGKIKMGSNPIVLGRANTYGDPKGVIDNFAIWSRALTQEEIQARAYNAPDAKDKDCRLLLTFDGSLQDQSQYHNDPAPLMDAILVEHDGIRPPHPVFTMSKEMKGQKVYVNDMTQDGVGCWWILPYPGKFDDYKTSEQRHVSQDFSRDPGTYSYTLVAKGTGNCNAYASTTQFFTVGGLSKVFPSETGPSDAVRLRIQGGYSLTYSKQPKVVLHSANGDFEGKWLLDKNYDSSKITSPDDLAEALFDLHEAPLGKYDVVIGTDTLYNGFELIEGDGYPDVWFEISGFEKMLWNKYQRYTIDFGNNSNVAAYNTPFFLYISDKDGQLDLSFDFPIECYGEDIEQAVRNMMKEAENGVVVNTKEYGPMRGYMLNIPYIAPNGEGHLDFRVSLKNGGTISDGDIDMLYGIGQSLGAYDPDAMSQVRTRGDTWPDERKIHENWDYDLAACLGDYFYGWFKDSAIGAIPGVGCVYGINKAKQAMKETHDWAVANMFVNTVSAAISCIGTVVDVGTLGGSWVIHTAAEFIWNGIGNVVSVGSCLAQSKKFRHLVAVRSYDPNEMIGPWGPDDARHYIKPIQQMPYMITFENKSSATAPAHEVFVTDVLDASKYDFSTFSFTGFGWAEQSYTVGGSKTKEFTRDITYNVKGQDILVRVSGQFDEKTGTVLWSFVSLKKNGDEIEDPDLGFLLPNNDNRDGEGFVSFIIEHKANPANGSTISNKATIVFDANDPIVTNTYVNTFDTDYPSSQITKVEEKNGQLVVTVSGSDATSGIGTYHIYAFKNGGAAELVATITEGNQATFACDPGTKYGLCVIATDNVGWNEPKDIKAEKEVTTSGTGINGILVDDPASSDFIDMQGRRLKDPKASGVYIQNKKKVFIKKLIQDDLK